MKMHKQFIMFAGYTLSLGLATILFYIFLKAYQYGHKIIIYINNYGEANFELILFPITLLFCLIGLWFTWKDLKQQK